MVSDHLNQTSEQLIIISPGCSKTVDDGDLSAKTLVKYEHPVQLYLHHLIIIHCLLVMLVNSWDLCFLTKYHP